MSVKLRLDLVPLAKKIALPPTHAPTDLHLKIVDRNTKLLTDVRWKIRTEAQRKYLMEQVEPSNEFVVCDSSHAPHYICIYIYIYIHLWGPHDKTISWTRQIQKGGKRREAKCQIRWHNKIEKRVKNTDMIECRRGAPTNRQHTCTDIVRYMALPFPLRYCTPPPPLCQSPLAQLSLSDSCEWISNYWQLWKRSYLIIAALKKKKPSTAKGRRGVAGVETTRQLFPLSTVSHG